MRLFLPGGSSSGVTSVTGTAPITSSGGATPAIGLTPITYWQTPGTGTSIAQIPLGGANQVYVSGVPIYYPISAGHLTFDVGTADAGGSLYDVGFYNAAGTLVANLGATAFTTTGFKTTAFAQGTVRFNPGLYFIGFTGNGGTLQIYGNPGGSSLVFVFGFNTNVATSSGGALPASITPPSAAAPDNTHSQLWLAMTP
ncbi:MAG TPA: hypothetical protein VM782_04275 [Stellaceae bacterium]|nr:hypothetical protein [Stellaceae bacterium]